MTVDATLGPIAQESSPSIIARKVREAIATGMLAQGAQLAEAESARRLGVSRGPLREAMQRLTQQGLLESVRNKGLFVVTLTADEVRDVYLARMAIESMAAERAILRDRDAACSALLETVAAMVAAGDDRAAVGVADIRLPHQVGGLLR